MVAILLAKDAGVTGPAAADELARALLATVAYFALCGYGLTRWLLPASLRPWHWIFVLPVGAATSGIALTLLGFAAVPFKVSLAVTIAAAAAGAVLAWRRPGDDRDGEGDGRYGEGELPLLDWRELACLFAAAGLIAAVALVPSFRSGFATVTGTASDAHQVAGAATFLQHNYPSGQDLAYPIDEVRAIWNSKYPIFYPLAATASLSGLESWQAMMSLAAVLLALTALGMFLFARRILGAGAGVAALAMALAVLDHQVFHVALHPYYNQLWGLMTLPFSIVLGQAWVEERRAQPAEPAASQEERRAQPAEPAASQEERSSKTFGLLALLTGVGMFAYPLMLPFPLVAVAGFYIASGGSVDPRGLWRGRRSLLWMVPLGLLLLVPLRGVFQKMRDAAQVLLGGERLENWGGDLTYHPPFAEFFALPDATVIGPVLAAVVIGLAAWQLWRLPRSIGVPLLVVLGGALLTAGWFAVLDDGQYFYFKLLSFSGPLIVAAAVVALSRLPWRPAAAVALVVLTTTAILGARDELEGTFDQLDPQTLELRDWSKQLPKGASIRIDTPDQLWRAYMLSDRDLGSPRPIKNFPHVPYSFGGDYALTEDYQDPPPDAATDEPLFSNEDLRLWKLGPLPGHGKLPDTTSRRLVPIAADKGVE